MRARESLTNSFTVLEYSVGLHLLLLTVEKRERERDPRIFHMLLLTVENPGIHRFHGEDVDARDGDSELRVRFRV